MDQLQARTIVNTEFPRDRENQAYCTMCLNPFTAVEDSENQSSPPPMEHYSSRGWLLHRALEFSLQQPTEALEPQPHLCNPECSGVRESVNVRDNPILRYPEAVRPEAFRWTGEDEEVLYCPTCCFPIHRGEGPFSAKGYRAELLRRALPQGSFQVNQELFLDITL